VIDDDDARCQPELLGLPPTPTDVHPLVGGSMSRPIRGIGAGSCEATAAEALVASTMGRETDSTMTIHADELQPGDIVDYHGEPHRVSHVDCHMGWSWPIAFDDAGWAMALGHDPVVVHHRAT
jgi:hypothetical protein